MLDVARAWSDEATAGNDKGVPVPKQDVVVTFEGQRYTYEDRAQLLSKLRARRLFD